jgi:hypothetical protein
LPEYLSSIFQPPAIVALQWPGAEKAIGISLKNATNKMGGVISGNALI